MLYLPSIYQVAKWRNSTCDCLDVLHWDALGISSRSGGIEGPIFVLLHLARLLLLSPTIEFQKMIKDLTSSTTSHDPPHPKSSAHMSRNDCEDIIWCWFHRDRYKARLAVLHAGGIFWHVRRYSSDSIIQPLAVFLATLVLWGYATCSFATSLVPMETETYEGETNSAATKDGMREATERHRPNSSMEDGDIGDSDSMCRTSEEEIYASQVPEFMHIDRPFDDELAQHFIRSADRIKAFIEGVGDLSTNKSTQVLSEGARVLRKWCKNWSISNKYAQTLEQVATLE